MCPNFAEGREGGPGGMNKTLGCSVIKNFVGFLVDGVRCAKVQGVLL